MTKSPALPAQSLALDGVRPNLVAGLHALEYTAVGALAYPTPLDMQFVIAVLILGAHVTERIALDADIAVLHAEHLVGGNVALAVEHAYPSRQILSVEKFRLFSAFAARTRDDRRSQRRENKFHLHFISILIKLFRLQKYGLIHYRHNHFHSF